MYFTGRFKSISWVAANTAGTGTATTRLLLAIQFAWRPFERHNPSPRIAASTIDVIAGFRFRQYCRKPFSGSSTCRWKGSGERKWTGRGGVLT